MKRAILILALLVESVQAEPWSDGDTVGQLAVTATLVGDWVQTRQICADTDGPGESNPVIGVRCDRVSPDAYFALVIPLHAIAVRAIPSRWARRLVQGVTIAVQVDAMRTNFRAGYGFAW